jgi:hypothetical protein
MTKVGWYALSNSTTLESNKSPAGYDYGAKWGIAPAGLPPASTVARLAALPPAGPNRFCR